jgi:hypothetical protein
MNFKGECTAENAARVRDWIHNRGGVVAWQSLDLSQPACCVIGPRFDDDGTELGSPGWRYGHPTLITNESDIGVHTDIPYATVPIKLVRKGTRLVLSKASARELDRVCERCHDQHGDARYAQKTYDPLEALLDPEPAMLVSYSTGIVPLSEWSKHGPH